VDDIEEGKANVEVRTLVFVVVVAVSVVDVTTEVGGRVFVA